MDNRINEYTDEVMPYWW